MKMKMKKGLVAVLAVIMVLTALPGFAFAESTTGEEGTTETVKITNFVGEVYVDNFDCKETASLAGLNLEIQITSKADPAKSISVPLTYDAEWEEYYVEEYLSEIVATDIINDILAAQEAAEVELGIDDETLNSMTEEEYENLDFEALGAALLEKTFAGYTVALNGLGEDAHFRAELQDGNVETGADQIAMFELIVALLAPEEGFPEGEAPETMMELMDYAVRMTEGMEYQTYAEYVLAEFGEEEGQLMIAEVEAADELLAMARNGEYPNKLSIYMALLCDCPPLVSYEVFHQYLVEKDGKLVEIDVLYEEDFLDDEFWLEGDAGQEIYSDDFVRAVYEGSVTEYIGKTFEYVGSYDPWCDWQDLEADISGDELEEYVLSEDYDYDGFVLRYILSEETEDSAGEADDDQATTDKDDVATDNETAPLTGDDAPIGVYVALFVTAIGALLAILGLKKKSRAE